MSKENQSKTQKLEKLKEKTKEVTDGLGKELDEGIKDMVISLWANDIPTSGSCEGHLDWGAPAPWVDIGKDQPEEVAKRRQENPGVRGFKKFFEDYPELVPLRKENLLSQKKLIELLTSYYQDHQVTADCRLILTPLDMYGIGRLSNQGVEIQEVISPEQQEEKLKQYQQEMNDFAKFLLDNFLL